MSRYSICAEAVTYNLAYAKKMGMNFSATLFDDSILFYTNIKLSDATKENIAKNFKIKYEIHDGLTYDQIDQKIKSVGPNGGTDFMMTFQFVSMIPELASADIFFLSDGQNKHRLEASHLDFLKQFKDRTTTMGIGRKGAYDESTLSLMSNTNLTVEGNSADAIQQELMAKMADATFEADIWRNITVEIMGPVSSLSVGSLMNVAEISKEEYDGTVYTTSKESENLHIMNYGGYLVLKKINPTVTVTQEVEKKIDSIHFIIDRSGSMGEYVGGYSDPYAHPMGMGYYNPYSPGSPAPLAPSYGGGAALGPTSAAPFYGGGGLTASTGAGLGPLSFMPGAPPMPHYMHASPVLGPSSGAATPPPVDTNLNQTTAGFSAAAAAAGGGGGEPAPAARAASNHGPDVFIPDDTGIESETETEKYVKYTMKGDAFKSYQRFILKATGEFKGQITYTDTDGNQQTIVIHDTSKHTPVLPDDTNADFFKVVSLACDLGNGINSAYLVDNKDKIGLFRAMHQLAKTHTAFFDKMQAAEFEDMILIEMLFYNRKHIQKLYQSTLTPARANMEGLMASASGAAYRQLSAAATMSVGIGPTPSTQPHTHDDEDYHPKNRDMSMCAICYDEVRQYIFGPCGHCYACEGCAEKLLASAPMNKCSYCKQDVTSIRKLRMTDDQKNPDHYYKCISPACYNIAEVVSRCNPMDAEDDGYHLTYCKKCYKNVVRDAKKHKKLHMCFCGHEITKIKQNVYFN